MLPPMLDLAGLRASYRDGTSPRDVADALAERMAASGDPAVFITAVDRDGLRRQAEDLVRRAPDPDMLPLWGVPFAVKDNIDVAGLPTTAGCPAFATRPEHDAFVVARLRAAGALVTGKTNLDQFATGLNGTRSPHGAPRCVFDSRYVSGGSSSGSAVAVAAGLAAFSLGTDTAGSGRVPAAFNNIVGCKPTPGRLSATGVVPACRSLDTVTIFAATVADAAAVRRIAEGFDAADPFSRLDEAPPPLPARPRIGVLRPADREFFGDDMSARLYDEAIARLACLGAEAVLFDYAPFREAAALLYDGPWVAERLAALQGFHAAHADAIDATVRAILDGADRFTAVDAFNGRYALETLRRRTMESWAACDALLLPTSPILPTIEAMRADPIRLNSRLGTYTNFANLLGLAAWAVPAGFTADGMPFGVTLFGQGGSDDALAPLADALHRATGCGAGRARTCLGAPPTVPPPDRIEMVVVGAHLRGMPLNGELVALGGTFVRAGVTHGDYRLYALVGTDPPKPGLVRDPGSNGPGVPVEVWSLSPAAFGRFVAAIPAPLGIGRVALADATAPSGFLCERWAVEDATEIEDGWRAHVARQG